MAIVRAGTTSDSLHCSSLKFYKCMYTRGPETVFLLRLHFFNNRLLPPAFPTECGKAMFSQVCVRPHPAKVGTPPAKVGRYPPGKVGTPLAKVGTPPPQGLTTLRAVCLLRSRRRIFLFFIFFQPLVVKATMCWKVEWDELETNQHNFLSLCEQLNKHVRILFVLQTWIQ